MGKTPLTCLVVAAIATMALGAPTQELRTEYKATSGVRVVVTSKKLRQEATRESVLEFYSTENQKECSLDYSSEDREHGFGVVKASWTPDNQYFVFSLTSSGGHQAWHAPTFFYSPRDNEIQDLDDYVSASGVSKADFTLKAPNIVSTEVWRGESVPVMFRLDFLASSKHKLRHTLQCIGGRLILREKG
jgi:hypothetical protein